MHISTCDRCNLRFRPSSIEYDHYGTLLQFRCANCESTRYSDIALLAVGSGFGCSNNVLKEALKESNKYIDYEYYERAKSALYITDGDET